MDQASRAVRLVDRGQFKSLRQVSRAQIHRSGPTRWPPTPWTRGGQTRSFDEISRGGFGQIYTGYPAPICPSQSRAVTRCCGDVGPLNEPNARLGKNWLSRFLNRHSDLKTSRNRELDSKRITAAIPSQIEGWFTHVDDVVQRFNIHPQDRWNMDEIGYQLSYS